MSKKPEKPAPEVPAVPVELEAQPHGGALLVGSNYGNRGGGRPVDAFRAECREALTRAKGVKFLEGVIDGTEGEDIVVVVKDKDGSKQSVVVHVRPKIRDRLLAVELLADRGHGKPPQEVTIDDPGAYLSGEALMTRILELLPRVVAILPIDKQQLGKLFAQRRQVELLVAPKPQAKGNGHK